jgi:hypothetical protein
MSIGPRLIIMSEAAINGTGMKSTHMRSTPGIIEVEMKRKKGTRKERNLKEKEKSKNEARLRGPRDLRRPLNIRLPRT